MDDAALDDLLGAIHLRYGEDFRGYARRSLRRRLPAALGRFGCRTVAELRERVAGDAAAFRELLGVLTVQVSELFRDPPFFRALRREVAPALAARGPIRAWVAGCAGGEEAYGLAVLLREEGLLGRSLVYATDVDPGALERAEAGVFASARVPAFSRNYLAAGGRGSLSEHYTAGYGAVVFDRDLRRRIRFAAHSLATDGVFSELELVTCRNVLIYFEAPLRERALGLFRASLPPGGFLGLGLAETLRFSGLRDAFAEVDRGLRLYRRVGEGCGARP